MKEPRHPDGSARAGRPRELVSLVESYAECEASLRRYVRRFLGDAEDVEDVLHETFLRVYRAARGQHIRSPKAFLFTTAKHVALSELSRLPRRRTETLGAVEVSDERLGARPVERQAEDAEALSRLARVYAALPEKCRQVLWLRKIDGLSHRQIARRLGIAVSTVEKHLAKGMRRCREGMAGRGRPQ